MKFLFLAYFVIYVTTINAQNISKKCKTCGKPLVQCQYKGKHPATIEHQRETTGYENGHEWVDLGFSVKLATCNVGASSPSDIGGYYAWGEIHSTKNENGYNPNYTYKGNPITLKNIAHSKYDVATTKWRGTWSIPTVKHMEELVENVNGCGQKGWNFGIFNKRSKW